MIVMKFGGTSVGSTDAITAAATIVAQKMAEQAQTPRPGVAVVTSAMSGVTNTLIDSAQAAAAGDEGPYREARSGLLVKHQMVCGQLIEDGVERAALGRLFDNRLREYERLCRSIAVLGELTARGMDVVSGLGERLSAPLLAAVLRANGVKAQFIDAGELIITDDNFGCASPLMEQTYTRCVDRLLPMLQSGVVPVITGFVGATLSNHPNDQAEALPTVDAIAPQLGRPAAAALDKGYFSQNNIAGLESRSIDPYIATGREPHHVSWTDFLAHNPTPPPDASPTVKMAHKLKTAIGHAIYDLRKSTVEPVIGIIKAVS